MKCKTTGYFCFSTQKQSQVLMVLLVGFLKQVALAVNRICFDFFLVINEIINAFKFVKLTGEKFIAYISTKMRNTYPKFFNPSQNF